jgi:hypothetical protein
MEYDTGTAYGTYGEKNNVELRIKKNKEYIKKYI